MHDTSHQRVAGMGGIVPTVATEPVDLDARDVGLARGGDMGAAERLYRRHQRRVWNLARVMMRGAEQDAEDVCQEVFLRALSKLDQFRGDARFFTWLARITVNQVRNRQAKHQVRMRVLCDSGPDPDNGGSRVALASSSSAELRAALAQAISSLSERQREAVCCHDVLGMNHKEIAYALGCAEGTSKAHLHRARLRELLTGSEVMT